MYHLIINPTAGNGKALRSMPTIVRLLKTAQLPYQLHFSEALWHCAELTQQVIMAGGRKIVAVGGDGTGHEVVNGILGQNKVSTDEVSFGCIPIGTGNDWIKTHGIPKDFKRNINILKQHKTILQDIGKVFYHDMNDQPQMRYFYNVAGMAYDGYIGKVAHESRDKMSASWYYYYLIFKCLFEYQPSLARIVLDDEQYEDLFYTINIGLCKYSGGGMQFTPHAVIDDGQFAVSSVQAMSKWRVVLSTHYLYGGKIVKHPKARLSHSKSVRIDGAEMPTSLLELDGEFVGQSPAQFDILPSALRVIVP